MSAQIEICEELLIIAAVCNDDTEEIITKKIQMVSKFVDAFASIRIFNYRKVNWNTNKYMLFRVLRDIRNQDCNTVGKVLVRELKKMDISIDGILSTVILLVTVSWELVSAHQKRCT